MRTREEKKHDGNKMKSSGKYIRKSRTTMGVQVNLPCCTICDNINTIKQRSQPLLLELPYQNISSKNADRNTVLREEKTLKQEQKEKGTEKLKSIMGKKADDPNNS